MRILNSLIVPKYIKRETLWVFWYFSLLQNIKKLKGGNLWRRKKSKKSRTVPKKIESRTVPKKSFSKQFLAKARTRTRDRWVQRKPSKDCTDVYTWTSEVCKKYIHDEVCGLTKKKEIKTSHCNNRALFTKNSNSKDTQVAIAPIEVFPQNSRSLHTFLLNLGKLVRWTRSKQPA